MPMSGNQITKLGDLIMDMKDNTIMLFVNDKEGNEKRPDFSGKALWMVRRYLFPSGRMSLRLAITICQASCSHLQR